MIGLGSGLTMFSAGGAQFGVDLVGWVNWYIDEAERYKDNPHRLLPAVLERLKSAGIDLGGNLTLADAFLHAVFAAYDDIKKKQREERMSPSSTDSTRLD